MSTLSAAGGKLKVINPRKEKRERNIVVRLGDVTYKQERYRYRYEITPEDKHVAHIWKFNSGNYGGYRELSPWLRCGKFRMSEDGLRLRVLKQLEREPIS